MIEIVFLSFFEKDRRIRRTSDENSEYMYIYQFGSGKTRDRARFMWTTVPRSCAHNIFVRYLQCKSGRNNRFNKPGFLMRFGVTEKALSSKPNSRIKWMVKMKCVENAFDDGINRTQYQTITNTEQKNWIPIFFRGDVVLIRVSIQSFLVGWIVELHHS